MIVYDPFVQKIVRDFVITKVLRLIDLKGLEDNYRNDLIIKLLNVLLIKYTNNGLLCEELMLLSGVAQNVSKILYPNSTYEKLLEEKKDLVDSEHHYYVTYGIKVGQNRIPVTLITAAEKMATSERRWKCYLDLIRSIVVQNPVYIELLPTNPKKLLLGKIMIVNRGTNLLQTLNLIPNAKHGVVINKLAS